MERLRLRDEVENLEMQLASLEGETPRAVKDDTLRHVGLTLTLTVALRAQSLQEDTCTFLVHRLRVLFLPYHESEPSPAGFPRAAAAEVSTQS